ncbi:histidine kinase [Chitinophaga sedimenti]|uniref:histidine kinase n=1 Tax=Chitinophaga sedimenti TaxID=2033606 RepID=UPI00200503C5|nr:histidine kinase [Chitinophaga sedimenti]MCK7558241.1 histidine kinase [Chitinophaga sedimenti]
MTRLFLTLLLFCSTFTTNAGTTLEDYSAGYNAPRQGLDLRPHLGVLRAGSDRYTIQEVLQLPFHIDTSVFHAGRTLNNGVNSLWLKLTVRNNTANDSSAVLFAGWHDYMYWYEPGSNGQYRLHTQTGLMTDNAGVERWDHYAFPVEVPAGQTKTYYLHISNSYYRENALQPLLFNQFEYYDFRHVTSNYYKQEALIIQIIIGMLLVFLSITVINYTQLPDRSSLYFAGYILGLIVYFALRLDAKPYQLSFSHHWPKLKYYWDIPALFFCFYVMYFMFGNVFLSLRERYPLMEKIFRWSAWVSSVLMLLSVYCIYRAWYDIPGKMYTYFYFGTLAPLGAGLVALAQRSRHHPLIRFFLFGSIAIYVLSFCAFVFNREPVGLTAIPELVTPSGMLVVGVLLQALFFAAGLSYRNKLVHQEKTKTQELLIKQLNKNKELQRKLNEQLEELVKEQTTEILRKKQELEEQRKLQLEIEYGKKLSEIELKAIRAQINPHFIFNCLNSIQLFVMQRDYEYAQKYLSDFSYLIRKTLDFSRRNFISLSDEITYLNTYLGLEKMRFEHKMEYEIVVDPTIPTGELEVPAMLLQPYVENAVKHGMNNEAHTTGKLTIRFNQDDEEEMLECVIEDNGIGIERSKALRQLPPHHQSSGMEISLNRAELLNKMYNTEIQIEIIDKTLSQYPESGTIVRILIPQL